MWTRRPSLIGNREWALVQEDVTGSLFPIEGNMKRSIGIQKESQIQMEYSEHQIAQ